MLNSQRLKALPWINGILRTSPTSQCFRLSQQCPWPAFSLQFSTIASSDNHSFTVSYLINNLGFSQEAALEVSKTVRFETAQKPDAAISFLRSHGFSEFQLNDLVKGFPWLLICKPQTSILPKFEFLISKGATTSDLNFMVLKSPRFLRRSLKNHIIPTYEVLKGVFQNDKTTISNVKVRPNLLYDNRVVPGINTLLKNGVSRTTVAVVLKMKRRVLNSHDVLTKALEEVKCLGFDPLKTAFAVALIAKTYFSKSCWEAKVDAFKRWGWSEEALSEAFRKHPQVMLTSEDKINAVMSFWVNQLGRSSLLLLKGPYMFSYSLKRRIIPRGSVIHYLQSKGLIEKNASLVVPFTISEKHFMERFVKRFEEHNHHLLKIYEENLKNDGSHHVHENLKF